MTPDFVTVYAVTVEGDNHGLSGGSALSESGVTVRPDPGYTVVGVINDGAELNQAVGELRGLGVDSRDLTVVMKREDPEVPEPFPQGTRYIVIPDDSRGLELTIAFAAVFAVSGLLFAFTAPTIGAALFVFFMGLAALLAVSSFIKVGVDPILIDLEVPSSDSVVWNEEFENGKVLIFAATEDRRRLQPMWEVLGRQGAEFYVIERRLEPRPVGPAVLHEAGAAIEEDLAPVPERAAGE